MTVVKQCAKLYNIILRPVMIEYNIVSRFKLNCTPKLFYWLKIKKIWIKVTVHGIYNYLSIHECMTGQKEESPL
jgi:hypothetical protein